MSGEWTKQTILDLISAYKDNENLYNPKHILYHNKQARNNSNEKILQAVKNTKKDATINDVVKKIQILRTQFGQEINKIEKSKSLGDDMLVYEPKIWWFKNLKFIAKFMKMRSDPSTPLSVKLEGSQKATQQQDTTIRDEDDEEVYLELTDNAEDEIEPTPKKRKIELVKQSSEPQTIEYIINEETSELIHNDQFVNAEHVDSKKFKRRSKAFGNYVGSLMREIKDDKIFFEAQNEILRVIDKATSKSFKQVK